MQSYRPWHLSIESAVGRPVGHLSDIHAPFCQNHLSTETTTAVWTGSAWSLHYVHVFIHTYVYVGFIVHAHVHTCSHVGFNMQYLRTWGEYCLCVYVHTYVLMYVCTYVHTYVYVHTYIHTYIRTCMHAYNTYCTLVPWNVSPSPAL